ncbi:MAG TPA: GNAT family N-acetyltransferase [Actinocatenispora sp.]
MVVRLVPPSEILVANGVTLRRFRAGDARALHGAIRASLSHLRPWMPWATDEYDRDGVRGWLTECAAKWDAGHDFQYAIVLDGQVVGSIGLMSRIGPGALEIGYWVDVRHTRKGVASRAAAAISAAGLAVPGIGYVEIRHDPANAASAAVPRTLGYTRVEDTVDGDGHPVWAWRLAGGDLAASRVPEVLGQRRYR